MTKGIISIAPSSIFHAYVAAYSILRYVRACLTYDRYLIRDSLLHVTNKLMSQEFLQFCLQGSFCKFYVRYNDLVCQYNLTFRPYTVWCISYQSLRRPGHTNHDHGSYYLPDLEKRLEAVATGRQSMLTPRHLIPLLEYPEVHICPHSVIWISYRTYEINVFYLCHFMVQASQFFKTQPQETMRMRDQMQMKSIKVKKFRTSWLFHLPILPCPFF
jgi:hypothetical protein